MQPDFVRDNIDGMLAATRDGARGATRTLDRQRLHDRLRRQLLRRDLPRAAS